LPAEHVGEVRGENHLVELLLWGFLSKGELHGRDIERCVCCVWCVKKAKMTLVTQVSQLMMMA
jgi:hypothetical protein